MPGIMFDLSRGIKRLPCTLPMRGGCSLTADPQNLFIPFTCFPFFEDALLSLIPI